MYASLSYIQTRHPYGEIPGQPSQAPDSAPIRESAPDSAAPASASALPNGNSSHQQVSERASSPPPETPDSFNGAMHELARDLMLKEQQIEILINSLPGIGNSEADQEKRMRELETELREVGMERTRAEDEKERMADLLGQIIVGAKRVP